MDKPKKKIFESLAGMIIQDSTATGKESLDHESLHVFQIVKGSDIFPQSIAHLLKKTSREFVLIYAPTGVWNPGQQKAEWFKQLGACLAKHCPEDLQPPNDDKGVTTELWEFMGAYGLPFHVPQTGEPKIAYSPEELKEIKKTLNRIEEVLLPFNGLSNAKLYRLLIDASTVSGTGTIIFDDAVFTGFATSDVISKVDYGIFICDDNEVLVPITKWFRTHITKIVNWNHPIQNMDAPFCKDMHAGINDIRVAFGIPRKHRPVSARKKKRTISQGNHHQLNASS